MKLFHGTNIDFTEIDLSKSRPNKDFGQGFYLTSIFSQAREMAVRRCEFESCGQPIVQTYEFDDNALNNNDLNILIFESPSRDWAEFILKNRKSRGKKVHNYDIVMGPVADDGVVYQLNLYMQKIITLDQLVSELEYRKLNNQYFFGTQKAISKLNRI